MGLATARVVIVVEGDPLTEPPLLTFPEGPGKDISLNFAPVVFPLYKPAEMSVRPGEREFWRVLNASADTYFDLQLRYGPVIQDVNEPQAIELIALDGAPVGAGSQSRVQDVLLPPGARAATPPLGAFAQLSDAQV